MVNVDFGYHNGTQNGTYGTRNITNAMALKLALLRKNGKYTLETANKTDSKWHSKLHSIAKRNM
jgi:hypothetical protein